MQRWESPTKRDSGEDPAQQRPGYCNPTLGFWWPLSDAEAQALAGVERAKAGDASALLGLALVASGDRRDAVSYSQYQTRLASFVTQIAPTIQAAADDWHRGYELHRAMHRAFFVPEQGELSG